MTTLKQYEINRYSRILGYGAARGEVIVRNDDIVEAIDSSDEWIRQRTGIALARTSPLPTLPLVLQRTRCSPPV